MEKISISKKNYKFYHKLSNHMSEIIILCDNNWNSNNFDYVLSIRSILNSIEFNNPLNFKEFVADYDENDYLIEIDYQLYEQYIKASFAIKSMKEILSICSGKTSLIDFARMIIGITKIYKM